MTEKIKMAEIVGVVHTHTHTHTQCNLINSKKGIKNALLMIDEDG